VQSLNCNGFKSFLPCIDLVLKNCDILCLQELMIIKQECNILNNADLDFYGYGISPVNGEDGIITGRPYGGVGFLWRKSIDEAVQVINSDHNWLSCLKVSTKKKEFYVINVYLPYECQSNVENYNDCLAKLALYVDNINSTCIYIVGDFNADLSKESSFGSILAAFCEDNNLYIADELMLPNDTYTYVSPSWGTTSWLDHVLCTADCIDCISDVLITYDNVLSDHHPLGFSVNIDVIPECTEMTSQAKSRINWEAMSVNDIEKFRCATSKQFDKILIPDGIKCRDPNCKIDSHTADINDFYLGVVNILSNCGNDIVNQRGKRHHANNIPGWYENVESLHVAARNSYSLWKSHGKPNNGPIYNMMKKQKYMFKYALRKCKLNKNTILADKLATNLAGKSDRDFWKNVKATMNSRISLPTRIDDHHGNSEIADMWKNHYESIFNAVPHSNCSNKYDKYNATNVTTLYSDMIVSESEIFEIIKDLPNGKSSGLDGLTGEHLKYAGMKLIYLLSLLCTAIFMHGVLPQSMLSSVMVPIVKDKNKRVCDKNNYRPICLANICTKVLEKVMLTRLEGYIETLPNQFGFKPKLGTEMCVFLLKDLLRFYMSNGSHMFVAYLDASKAFDRVNHSALLVKLEKSGTPVYLLRLISFWYLKQQICVRWGDVTSASFYVNNGVRQGGILSPYLFNMYMNDLSSLLNKADAGCLCGNKLVGHLMYADDLVLFAPSAKGLQKLLNICSVYGADNDILYNAEKSKVMYCAPYKGEKLVIRPKLYINDNCMMFVDKYIYLGHIISDSLNDDEDIKAKTRVLYGRSNFLARKFHFCSKSVKKKLFISFCSNIYLNALWYKYNTLTWQKAKTAYNNAFRIIMGLEMRCSASGMFVSAGVKSFTEKTRSSMFSIMNRLQISSNQLLVSFLDGVSGRTSHLMGRWKNNLYSVHMS
jgi:exonuclease III